MENSNSVSKSLFWKLLERFGVQGVQFVLQIVLARLLDPEHYGVLSLMLIFTALANVFIQHGLNTALIQNKDVCEDDYSSVFWILLAMAGGFYGIIFFGAPFIGNFYKMPEMVMPLRVIALMLFPGALNAVQLAKVSREMNFKKVFFSNIGAIVVSGIAGIVIAYLGGGLWALVAQSVINVLVACIVMRATVKLKLRLVCNLARVKILFGFGWKLMLSSLIDTLYQDLRSLVIGKKYDSGTLGYYNRGKQFPQFIISAINGAVQSVMLPAMSAEQEDRAKVRAIMRNSIMLSSYIIFPLVIGLAAIASPLIKILLTDKWLPCVPYMQIYCFTFAFYPVHSCNLQAINAIGRSDVFLKLEIIKKTYGVLTLVLAVFLFNSPIAIAMTGAVTTIISCFVNAYPNKKLLNYSYLQQVRDMLPQIVLSAVMGTVVYLANFLPINEYLILLIQIPLGMLVYILGSMLFKLESFGYLLNLLKSYLKKSEG